MEGSLAVTERGDGMVGQRRPWCCLPRRSGPAGCQTGAWRAAVARGVWPCGGEVKQACRPPRGCSRRGWIWWCGCEEQAARASSRVESGRVAASGMAMAGSARRIYCRTAPRTNSTPTCYSHGRRNILCLAAVGSATVWAARGLSSAGHTLKPVACSAWFHACNGYT